MKRTSLFRPLRPVFAAFLLGIVGITGGCAAATNAPRGHSATTDLAQNEAEPGKNACTVAIPEPSLCSNDAAWVRGVARFDPSHLSAGATPVLRVVLRHEFVIRPGEEKIGGRLHAFTSVPVANPTLGEVPFAIDMCMFEHSMWSEENGTFHLVLILDENGDNDLELATTEAEAMVMATPGPDELVKMTNVEISCHGTAACLDVNLDCKGSSCTTIEPITSCTKKTPGCNSHAAFCR